MLRGLTANDDDEFPDELAAFRTAFQGRRFRLLLTEGILFQYQLEALKAPQFLLQPTLNSLRGQGRAIYLDEHRLNRAPVQMTGLPQEHQEFILDALAARSSYLVTNRQEWLSLTPQTSHYDLQVVTPRRFVELEGQI